jgi:alkylation response protein AidB-like acyl-CoA dehydrogenase
MQVFGGLGYSRHPPFRAHLPPPPPLRITEGTEEIHMRRVAGYLFGFMTQADPKGVTSLR